MCVTTEWKFSPLQFSYKLGRTYQIYLMNWFCQVLFDLCKLKGKLLWLLFLNLLFLVIGLFLQDLLNMKNAFFFLLYLAIVCVFIFYEDGIFMVGEYVVASQHLKKLPISVCTSSTSSERSAPTVEHTRGFKHPTTL